MKLKRLDNGVSLELRGYEAKLLFDELLDVPGGSRLPKLRQLCRELELWLEFPAGEDSGAYARRVKKRKVPRSAPE